jgi:predicted oxidoreductase (fatty acid repression mutant protein)
LISNEELEALGQMKVKQLKNRYNDPSVNRAFIIGVDRSKMRLYDVQQKVGDIVNANQVDEKEDAYNKFSDFKL